MKELAKRIKKNVKNIQVLVADTLSGQNNIELTDLVALLPSHLQDRAKRYKNKRSSISYCFGRLMLIQAIRDLGFEKDKLDELYFSENDKPLIDGFHFSISHSGNMAGLAYSKDVELGLDIEKKRPVELKNFKSFFRAEEWEMINAAKNPLEKFYWYWVRKESILKAEDGKMNQVHDIFITTPESGYFKNQRRIWSLNEFFIDNGFIGTVASKTTQSLFLNSPFILK